MSTHSKTLLTEEEYLELERRAESKSEFFAGEMFAMAGGSECHALIVGNVGAELSQRLRKKPCRVYMTNLRLRVSSVGFYTYPDVMVCVDNHCVDDQRDTVTRPVLIVEVLSPSTEDYDRGEKFQRYQTLDSLTEYLTVSQDRPHAELWTRQADNRWLLTEFKRLDEEIALPSVGCVLPMAEIYEKVEWPSR